MEHKIIEENLLTVEISHCKKDAWPNKYTWLIELHWQSLTALLLQTVFGVHLASNYLQTLSIIKIIVHADPAATRSIVWREKRLNTSVYFRPENPTVVTTASYLKIWIATIRAKSKSFDIWDECENGHDLLAKTFLKKYGQPLEFDEPSWYSKNPTLPHYKHHMLHPIPMIWESDNSVFLYPCKLNKDSGYGFSLTYESSLWQKVVSNWRSLMDEQRQLEIDKSKPQL